LSLSKFDTSLRRNGPKVQAPAAQAFKPTVGKANVDPGSYKAGSFQPKLTCFPARRTGALRPNVVI